LAMVLAGCSTAGQSESTAAIAGPAPAVGTGMAAGEGAVQTNTQGGQTVAVGKAVTLADASCDQIKAEMATFDADKIPQKLADFGKAKYHPTAEESIRFARYVDVSKAGKDKNCVSSGKVMKKKAVTASKMPVDPASKKMAKAGADVPPDPTLASAKGVPAAKTVAKAAAKPIMPDATQPADEGVTVQVPDSSG